MGVVVVCVGVYFYRDKPAKLVQTTDITQEVDAKRGEIVDYHFAFNAAQEEELGPPEENGWRLILQALGPRALEQNIWANTIPWDEFPTNPETKSWFEDFWTPLCEKFNLDPRERPTLLDAPTLSISETCGASRTPPPALGMVNAVRWFRCGTGPRHFGRR